MSADLGRELQDAGKAIGLLSADGGIDPSWFGHVSDRLQTILSKEAQRNGVLDLLDTIAPPATVPGLPAGEKWHPLLGPQANGNLYLTVNSSGSTVVVGMAGELNGGSADSTSLRAHLPVIQFSGNSVSEIAGTKAGPLDIVVRVPLNWAHSGNSIGLKALRAEVHLAPLDGQFDITLTLEGLDLDGKGAHDVVLDSANLGAEATHVVIGLIHQTLLTHAPSGPGEVQATITHLMGLFGLAGDGIPVFPFADLLNGPASLQAWLSGMIGSGSITTWFGHLAGLFGSSITVTGNGTAAKPWRIHLFDVAAGSGLDLTLTNVSQQLQAGLVMSLAGTGAGKPDARLEASAAIVGIPLSGKVPASVLPSASLVVRTPNQAATLISSAAISADALRAGVTLNGTKVAPILELLNVTLQGSHFDHIDLTNADSVTSLGTALVKTNLLAALGNNPAVSHLLALVGLAAPAGDATWPPLDLLKLVANPPQAIAAVHRAGFQPGHNWGVMLAEVGGLLGLAGAVTGTGTQDDPWAMPLAPPMGPAALQLAAWNAQTTPGGDPQLRLGLRLGAASGPWSAYWSAELLSFDLPASGSGNVSLLGGQHLSFELQPVPATPPYAGMTMSADSIGIFMDWVPGGPMQMYGEVKNIKAKEGAITNSIGTLRYPSAGAPPTTMANLAADLGLTQAQIDTLLRILLSRAVYSWADMPGVAVCVLLGLQAGLPNQQVDWPKLADPGTPSPTLAPLDALRAWIPRVVSGVSADGSPFLPRALDWLRALLGDSLPGSPTDVPMAGAPLQGNGVYDDPWQVELAGTDSSPVNLLLWMEPAGPPPAWAASLAAQISGSGGFLSALQAAAPLAQFLPAMRNAFVQTSLDDLETDLTTLSDFLSSGDGVVPLASQIPTGFTWTSGTKLTSAHHKQPSDPSAISQILAKINAWSPGNQAVLLLGPAFSDHTIWAPLLQQAESNKAHSTSPAANFNLRVPGVPADSIDLSSITVVADFYTADLQDDGTGDVGALSAQVARLAAAVKALRGINPILVAHSTAGIAARDFALHNPTLAGGLITLGTPHAGSQLTPLTDPGAAEAMRFVQRAVPVLPASPMGDALGHLLQALDGYLPLPPNPPQSVLPTAWPYPFGSFGGPGAPDTGGVQALALGSSLPGSLLGLLKTALSAQAATAANAANPAPTHLAVGVSAGLEIPSPGLGDINVDLAVRADLYRFALAGGVSGPERGVTIKATLNSPTGWLVGGATSFAGLAAPLSGTRVRWAELGATLALGGGSLTIAPFARLHDAAFQSATAGLVQMADKQAPALLGAVLHAIGPANLDASTPAGVLLDALTRLGLAVPDPSGGTGLSADAYTAIQVDPAGYLTPRLLTALADPDGLLGFSGDPAGPWTFQIGASPVELILSHGADWQIGIGIDSGNPLTFGKSASLSMNAGLHVPSLTYDVSLSFSVAATTLTVTSGGSLTISAPPWLDPLPLPPTAAAVEQAAVKALPRILLSSAVTTFFESAFGPLFRIGPLDKLIGAPGSTLSGSGSMGNGSGGFDATKINGVLQLIGTALGSAPGPGLSLPAGLTLAATGSDPVSIGLATTTSIGGVLDFTLAAQIDSLRHVSPAGTLSLTLPLGTWGNTKVQFGLSAAGVTLAIQPSGSPPIQLLPTFSGLGALAAGAGSSLLTQALDALNTNTSSSAFKTDVIALAGSLQLYNGTFSAESDNWKQLLQGNFLAAIGNKPGLLDAAKTILTDIGIPGTLTHTAGSSVMTWSSAVGSGTVNFSFGWDPNGPAFSVGAADVKLAGGPLHLNAAAGVAGNGTLQADLGLGFSLQQSIGITAVPQFLASYKAGGFHVDFYPLGGPASPLDISLLPTPGVKAAPGAMETFLLQWVVPVAANLVVKAKGPLTQKVPGTSLTVQQLVDGSGVLAGGKTLLQMGTGLLATLATAGTVTIANFKVGFVKDSGGFGLSVSGHQDIPADSIGISLRFGEVMSSPPWFKNGGITLYLFDSTLTTLTPKLSIKGLGIGFTGANGAPLINASFLRTGRMGGYVFFDLDLKTAKVTNFGAGVEIDQFGIPLGQALGGSGSGSNPVAAGLLQAGGGVNGGDTKSVNPAVDIWAAYLDGNFTIEIQNATGAIWIGIRQQFGPIYIDQVGLEITNNSKDVALLVDGSVQVAGFTVQADELGVQMPLNSLASPENWSLDLRGLAVSYSSSGVSIAGGLLKAPGAVVEYDGMLSIQIAGKGFTAVGSYATPKDGNDTYTSLFIFVALPLVLGGPPFFFVTGLGGGAGINRRLLVPSDITQIPNFLLVSAINDPSFANDPMGALLQIASNIPSRRGSYWFAAGIRFDTFVLIHSVAVVYVALDRGFEIGILGVSRLALPTEDVAIVSVELALKARFSSSEGILSIQAQLTDNSYLFSRSCQLTGGFAFFTWFPQGQFVLTIGGYHPAFQKPPQFPDVPRLGFRWSIGSAIIIKGEAYFALTNSCVMAGGRLEARLTAGPASAWFIAYADFLISWDPFHYDIAIGVEVGIALDFDVCFFVCCHVHLELSIGADLHIIGPPLHGTVTLKVLFFSITVPFGPDPNPKPNYIQDFNVFQKKYLTAGDANQEVVALRVTGGILPPDPPGAKPAPGTKAQPWQLAAEFSFITETRMPASSWSSFVNADSGHVPESADIDLAAMDKTNVLSDHSVVVFKVSTNAAPVPAPDAQHFLIDKIIGLFPEATWHWTDPTNMHAAARTVPAISGLNIQGVAVPQGQSALIPISKMVDDILQYDKPLPFATLDVNVISHLTQIGAQAEAMAAQLAHAPGPQMLQAAATVLIGANNAFGQARAAAGFPAQGLSPMAGRSLRRSRSAPPVVAPLTTGLTMKDPGLAVPPVINRPGDTGPVMLSAPRLRAVLRKRTKPLIDNPVAIRTTVLTIKQAAGAPRMLAPVPPGVAGAALRLIPVLKSPRPTNAAAGARVLHHPETGMLLGKTHTKAFVQAASQLVHDGVTLAAGTTHIWDLPASGPFSFVITGTAAVRIVALDRARQVLSDIETLPQAKPVAVPPNTAMVAFQCLGNPPAAPAAPVTTPATTLPPAHLAVSPAILEAALSVNLPNIQASPTGINIAVAAGPPASVVPPTSTAAPAPPAINPGMGAVSLTYAPPDSYPAAGWQVNNEFEQVGPSIVLGRGCSIKLASTSAALHNWQKTAQNIVRLSTTVLDQDGVATRLPASATVVVVLLDAQDPTAAATGDMAIAVDGATLVTPPIPVAGGRRRALLYDVKNASTGAGYFTVSVGSLTGWQVTAVAALHGTALEWANRMHGDVPEHLVPDGPLTPDGQVNIRLLPAASNPVTGANQ